ncbi:MAG: acyl-CoA thioesterase [Sciscionella sp.]
MTARRGAPTVLVDVLELERIEDDLFRGRSPRTALQRAFGGQVAGQALVAAGRTVPGGRIVRSLHGYFLRPGDQSVPIIYRVEANYDGDTVSGRRVSGIQHGRTIFSMSAAFDEVRDGPDHQDPMPEVPAPEDLEPSNLRPEPDADVFDISGPFDIRVIDHPGGRATSTGRPSTARLWLRSRAELPDDPLQHASVFTYASDLTLMATAFVPHRVNPQQAGFQTASLDHAMWFHRPFRTDEWLLYDKSSPSASGARGLNTANVFSQDGRLVISVVQEGLMRPPRP